MGRPSGLDEGVDGQGADEVAGQAVAAGPPTVEEIVLVMRHAGDRLPVGPLFCVIDGRTRGRPLTTTSVRACR